MENTSELSETLEELQIEQITADILYHALLDELTNDTNRNMIGLVFDIKEKIEERDKSYISRANLAVVIERAFNQIGNIPDDPYWISHQVAIQKAIQLDRIFGGTDTLNLYLKATPVDPALAPNLVFHEFGQQVHKIFGIRPLIEGKLENQVESQPENRFTEKSKEKPTLQLVS